MKTLKLPGRLMAEEGDHIHTGSVKYIITLVRPLLEGFAVQHQKLVEVVE
jgi:hypothetical protein